MSYISINCNFSIQEIKEYFKRNGYEIITGRKLIQKTGTDVSKFTGSMLSRNFVYKSEEELQELISKVTILIDDFDSYSIKPKKNGIHFYIGTYRNIPSVPFGGSTRKERHLFYYPKSVIYSEITHAFKDLMENKLKNIIKNDQ